MKVVPAGPIGGDIAEGYECNECGSTNVVYDEYQGKEVDSSELGISCEDCGGYEDPWLFGLRHEPEWNPEYKKRRLKWEE